jgi:putative membrane protein
MRIDATAARQIEAAFAAAQARTSAPLICVVAEASADYALAPSLGAAALALAAPWPFLMFTDWPAPRVFLIQLVVFALALALVAWLPVRVALAGRARRRSAGHRAALVQFARAGLDHAPGRNGTLLYVSLAERYARVIADSGVAAPHEAWRGVIAELASGLREGAAGPALTRAAERMAEMLSQQFPATPGASPPSARRFHML